MRAFLNFLAFLTAIVFVAAAIAGLLAWPLLQIVTDREALKEALAEFDQLVLDGVPPLVANALEVQARQQGVTGEQIDEAQLRQALQALLPPAWIDAQTETAVDAFYDILEGDRTAAGDVDVQLNMQEVLDNLEGEAGVSLVAVIVNGIPDCPNGVAPAIQDAGDVSFPSCIAAGVPRAAVTQQIHEELVVELQRAPGLLYEAGELHVPVERVLAGSNEAQGVQRLQQIQEAYAQAQQRSWLLWALPLACLILITLFAVRSVSGLGHWWGWPLLLAGGGALLLTLVAPSVITLVLQTAVLPGEVGVLVAPARTLARQVADTLVDVWLGEVYLWSGITVAVGVVLIAIGFLTAPRMQKN